MCFELGSTDQSVNRSVLLLLGVLGIGVGRVHADLFVVLLESGEVLARLHELALLHALAHIPVHERSLRIHEVELLVEASPRFGNRRRVAQHAHGTLHFGQVAAGHGRRRLIVEADLEAGRTPVDELDGLLGLDGGYGRVDVLGDDIAAIQHAAGHVLALARIALDHLIGRLEHGRRDVGHAHLLVLRLLRRHDGRIGGERKVNARIGHQIGLELGQVDVERAGEAQRGRYRAHNLRYEPIEVGVRGPADAQIAAAYVVDGLVVDHEGAVGVLQGGVRGQYGVVGLDDSGRDLRRRIDGKLELALLAVVHAQLLHEQRGEARAGAAAKRVEYEKAL